MPTSARALFVFQFAEPGNDGHSWGRAVIGQSHSFPASYWSRKVLLIGDNNWQHLSEISNWVFEG